MKTKLVHTQTLSTSALPLERNESVSPLEPTGVWNQDNGTLVVLLSKQLAAQQETSFSFVIRNQVQGQDSATVSIEVHGLIAKTPADTGQGNQAALLIASFLQRDIGQLMPAMSAFNTIAITIRARARLEPGTTIVISGLLGALTPDTASLPLRGEPAALAIFGSKALWLQVGYPSPSVTFAAVKANVEGVAVLAGVLASWFPTAAMGKPR